MSVIFAVPGPLRDLAGGRASLHLEGAPATVREALGLLRDAHPPLYERVMTESGEVRPHVNLFVGATEIRRTGGLETPLAEEGEVVILPSVSGGGEPPASRT